MADTLEGSLEALSGVFQKFTGSIGALTGPLEQMAGTMTRFVAALSPATVQQLNLSFASLYATIGQAFMPAVQALSSVVRSVADELSPLMRQLAPVFQDLVEIIGGRLLGIVRVVATLFGALVPVLDALMPLFEALQEVQDAMLRTGGALAAAFVQLVVSLGSLLPLKGIIDGLIAAFKEVTKQVVLFTAYLAKALGFEGVIESLIKAFNPAEGMRAAPAGPAGIQDLQSVGKALATASATAQGGGETNKDEKQYLADIAAALKDVKDNGKGLSDFLREQFNRVVNALLSLLPGDAAEKAKAEENRRQQEAEAARGVRQPERHRGRFNDDAAGG